jgi:hypothetical protein
LRFLPFTQICSDRVLLLVRLTRRFV